MNPTEITACIKQAIYDYSEAINQIDNTDMEMYDIRVYLFYNKLQFGLCRYFQHKFGLHKATLLSDYFKFGDRYIEKTPISAITKQDLIFTLQFRKNFLNKYL